MDLTTLHITSDALLSLLIMLVCYIGRDGLRKLNTHIETCNRRAVQTAKTTQWIVGSIYQIGNAMKISLPPKPEEKLEE
jgi:hypothetical protein